MKSPFYMNINGKYGCGAYERPDYRTLVELLAAMDRLGIWQTVAYHSNARDLHPVYGNRMLLADIESTLGARERVIPAFAANPSMTAGKGEMEHLLECLKNAPAACVILFPKTNRYRMVEITRILEQIRVYRPVILIDVTEMDTMVDIEDLIALAHRFSELRFVVKQVMWWQFSRVFDAMLRTDNIFIDTSWLHTRDCIKIVCEQVGDKRAIFGVGTKAHSGAAIAGLAYANLPQKTLDAIAYENFVSLFTESAKDSILKNRKSIGNAIQNGFWNYFIDGNGC